MNYVQTYNGEMVSLTDPDPDTILLADIAHALAYLCRFTGHTEEHYSIAQHCVLMARQLRDQGHQPTVVSTALMHDAHEAYIGDLSSPVKGLCPDYQEIELRMWRAVAQRFCLPRTIPVIVRMADARMLVTEAAQLFLHGRLGEGWPPSPPYPIPITCWSADRAEHEFLAEADRCQIS